VDEAMVAGAFGRACEVIPDPVSGTPMVVPRGRHHGAGASIPPSSPSPAPT
jgi:iron complex transport system ATP-binding protein